MLRRVIEDRAAILALKRRSTENEVMLMKAKSRQLHISKILERQDQDIARFTAKAKRELTEYNGRSNQYIHSFVLAFDNGDMDDFNIILSFHLWKSLNSQSADARLHSLKRYNRMIE